MNQFITKLHRPGFSPDIVTVVLGEQEYRLRVPQPFDLLDIAATYNWAALLPGSLLDEDFAVMEDNLADPDHKLTARRLHVAIQPLGTYLYGWPFFMAARALGTLRLYEPTFRTWAVLNVPRPLDGMSAADWVAASVAWQMQMGKKEEDRNNTWARLTIPGRLPMDAPGVTPDWMRASEMS